MKNVNTDLSIIAEFELDDDTIGTVTQAKFAAKHFESLKGDTESTKDTYTLMVKAKLSDTYDLTSICDSTNVVIETDDGYSFSALLSQATKSRLDKPEKGGSATFVVMDYDSLTGSVVKSDTLTIVWNKTGAVTFKVNGQPPAGSNMNMVDLTGEMDGAITGPLS